MMKHVLLALTLLTVALLPGCATGGGGHTGANIIVTVNTTPPNQSVVGVTLTVQFTATVTNVTNHSVTWSLTQSDSSACTAACGTIDANGLYAAPAVAPNPAAIKVVATSVENTTRSGSFDLTIIQITVTVTPKANNAPLNVVKGVSQQFTAAAVPDVAPQTFTWSLVCDAGANLCGTVDANGLYTAPNTIPNPATVHVTATSTVDTTGTDTVDITIVKSRLAGTSFYAFRLSGFDATGAIAVAGNFTTNADGTAIAGGIEDDLTSSQYSNASISSGSLALDTNDHGTLTLNTSAGTRAYKVALNADGDARMIEFDSTARRGSGEFALADSKKFKNTALPSGSSFVFGLTGVRNATQRAGFAGLFKPNGAGVISSGMLDRNENGVPGAATDITGTYSINDIGVANPGRGTMTLTSNSFGNTFNYAVYVVAGQANKATNPLTLFVISTDNPLANPAVSGTIVFQDPTPAPYDAADFNNFAVSSLTGVDAGGNTLVSLTSASGDGAGKINAIYDANNAGTIVTAQTFTCTYTSSGNGRYIVTLLGNSASCGSNALPFVFYASANSRGFLLDQSSAAVYTGQMDLQPGVIFAAAELAGSFAAATANPGSAGVDPGAFNFLFKSALPDFTVAGKRDDTDGGLGQTLAGTYTVSFNGTGTVKLSQPAAENFVTYLLDNTKNSPIQHFIMINVDPASKDSAIIFAER